MRSLFQIINRVFDVILAPMSPFLLVAGIVFLSFISAVLVLIVFKHTSNQKKIRYQKKKISGNLIQIVLYNDQIKVIVSSILSIIKHNIIYLGHTIPSLLVVSIPLFIFTTQVNNRYGYAPMLKDQVFIVQVELDKKHPNFSPKQLDEVALTASPGITIETNRLRIRRQAQIFWRARLAQENPEQYIRLVSPGQKTLLSRRIVSGAADNAFGPRLLKYGSWQSFIDYAENYIPESSLIRAVKISYDRMKYPLLFWNVDAIIFYFVVTLIFAFLFKPFFKVAI